ncbi:MAG TPA: ABC transporter permease [Jiangellaceae bacterium]
MLVFIVRRVIISFFVLLAGTFIMYLLVANAGNPLGDLLESRAPNRDALIAARIDQLNLDVPAPLRYFTWLPGAAGCLVPFALECDLGETLQGQDVTTMLGVAMGQTLQLVLVATVTALVLGIVVGIVTALRQYSGLDYSVTFASFLFYSLPIFWVAVLLKEYGAIKFNDWLADPLIPTAVALVLGLISGLVWMVIIAGDRNRRLTTFAVAFVATAGAAWALSATRWFEDPGLGPMVVAVSVVGIAFGTTALVAGFRYRNVLYAALSSAAIGIVCYFALGPVLDDPGWPAIVGLALVAVAVGVGLGYGLGGLQRRQAIQAAVLTALGAGGLIFLDRTMSAWEGYYDRVNGRVIATIGARTPDFEGTFWETTLDSATHLILPTIAIVLISFATYTRYTRSNMLEVMNQDHVRTARSKGLTERTVVVKHAFRNAMIPITTLMAFDFAGVIGGAVITEQVFGWSGMGQLFIRGLTMVDPNPVMGFFLVTGTAAVLFNMFADIAYAYLDPRIRLS